MTPSAFEKAARALPGSEFSVKWGADHCFVVGGKMFAATDEAGRGLSIKLTDIAFEVLTGNGRARPSPYLARAKWVRFDDLSSLDDDEVADWLKTAHGLVAARLTRKVRAELGL